MSIKPTQKQNLAITHPPSPLMIIAGAGTGKTYTLENRIIYMINNFKINPENILAITYTEKAANELKQRIIDQSGEKADKISVNTFHSFCYKILKDYSKNGISSIFEESESVHLLLSKFDEFEPFQSDLYPLNPQKAIIDSFIPFFNQIKDELIDLNTISIKDLLNNDFISEEILNQIKDLKRIYPIFQKWKHLLKVIDYGDMILLTYQLLKSDINILKKIQNQFQHLIIDEFQDNNYALNKIISLIAGNSKSITVVGDNDQVIYSFRGASEYNIKSFKNNYGKHPNFKIITLEENFRSKQGILDLANFTIKKNKNRIDKVLTSKNSESNEIPIKYFGNELEQNNFLISEIKNLIKKKYNYNDIAILCRTHNQGKKISKILKKSGLPINPNYPDFFGIPEIRDIISWTQLIASGSFQNSALFRVLKREIGYKSTHNIFQLLKKISNKSLILILCSNKQLLKKYPEINKIIEKLIYYRSLLHKRSVGQLIWEIAKNQSFLLKAVKRYSPDDQFILLNIGKLLKKSQDFTKRYNQDNSLDSFNLYLEAMMKSGSTPSKKPLNFYSCKGLMINTIHGVKGAEFPIVFLPYQRSGSFPLHFRTKKLINRPPDEWLNYKSNYFNSPKDHHYEEERRLFYVGITRAMNKLYILAPEKATSKFIKELPNQLTENKDMIKSKLMIKSRSELKVKYEQYLLKALADESYEEVKKISIILSKIKDNEKGKKVIFENTFWDNKLKNDLKKEFVAEIPKRINLSASSIETYNTCPLKYRLSKHDGIPQNASKPELIFGDIIHSVLQRFHEPKKELTNKRILRLLSEEWKKGEFDYKVREDKFKEQGIEILNRYCDMIQLGPPNVVKREEKFIFNIDQITIRGAIDRIDKNDDGISIVDYKTSNTPTSAKSSLQLAIYCIYLKQLKDREIGGLPKNSSLYFLRIKENPQRNHSFNLLELKKIEDKIKSVAKGIRKNKFEPIKGKHCEWCDYKNLLCPAWEK